jgi:hypothetical protein
MVEEFVGVTIFAPSNDAAPQELLFTSNLTQLQIIILN